MDGKPKVKLVRRQPPSTEDVEEFVKVYEKMVSQGDFDAYLDILLKATDGRLRKYFEDNPEQDPTQAARAEKLKRLREAPGKLVPGYFYGVHGSKYSFVRVKFLGIAKESESEGVQKARVQIVVGAVGLDAGGVYKLPTGALKVLPESQEQLARLYANTGGTK